MAAFAALLFAASAGASDATPLKLVVPFAAGTPTDSIARTLAQGMSGALARPVVVDNRPGAAGGIGTEFVTRAPPDGHTLLLTVNSTVSINPLIYGKLKYDPLTELAPLALVATGGYLLVAKPQLGLHSVDDLVRAARAQPEGLRYASYGNGSMSHMCAEVFQSMAGVRLLHVPYKSGSLNDLLGGHVDVSFEPTGPAIPHAQSGKLDALAATGTRRLDALPAVPVLGETMPGYDCTAWVGVLAPSRVPPDVQKALGEQVVKIAGTPAFARQMKEIGLEAQPAGPQAFAQMVREDHLKWARVLKPLNIRLD